MDNTVKISIDSLLEDVINAFDRGYSIGFVDGSVNSTVENNIIPDNKDRIKQDIINKIKSRYDN